MNYLNTVASKFGVLSNIQFNTTVLKSVWNEETKMWTVETGTGQIFKGDVKPRFQFSMKLKIASDAITLQPLY